MVALFQIAIWIGCGQLVLGQKYQLVKDSAEFKLPAVFAVWVLLFFLLGYQQIQPLQPPKVVIFTLPQKCNAALAQDLVIKDQFGRFLCHTQTHV